MVLGGGTGYSREEKLDKRFMLGDVFDGLAIRSYLDSNGLIENVQSYERGNSYIEGYILKNGMGEIGIVHNRYFNTTRVIMSEKVSEDIAEVLHGIGKESREKFRKKIKSWDRLK